jgi:hypothetical protein
MSYEKDQLSDGSPKHVSADANFRINVVRDFANRRDFASQS